MGRNHVALSGLEPKRLAQAELKAVGTEVRQALLDGHLVLRSGFSNPFQFGTRLLLCKAQELSSLHLQLRLLLLLL